MTEAPIGLGEGTQALIDTAGRAVAPQPVIPGELYSVVIPDGGSHKLIDLDLDKYRNQPRRKAGTVRVHNADTLIAYIDKHGLPQTEVWADVSRASLVAVINAHMGTTGDGVEDYAGWSDHRAVLEVRKTPSWEAWIAHDRKWLSQTEFAEHIEDRAVDIVQPSGAEMLELAQSITATVGVEFESSKQLSSGERQLEFKETVNAKAGTRGRLDIPTVIELALVPFEGAPRYKVTARFRFRINGGDLRLSYALERPEDVVANAFTDIVTTVGAAIEQPMYSGVPA
jgi:uncharacterized protein YfdQ (DUF2303 family)